MNGRREYGDQHGGQWRIVAWGGVVAIIVMVWVLQRFTGQPEWSPGDFVFAAGLLAVPLAIYELAARKSRQWTYRAGAGMALIAAMLLIWINGAVGIIGSEDNPANLMYAGVLLIAFSGAFVARFSADGLERTMRAAAIGHVVVTVIAMAFWLGSPCSGPVELIMINGFFFVLWWGASGLFGMAVHDVPPGGVGREEER